MVLISFGDYEGLLETLEILADQELARAIQRGLEEAASGEVLSEDEMWGSGKRGTRM